MKVHTFKIFAMSVSVFFLVSGYALAQGAKETTSFEQLQVLVKPGDRIYVTDSSGATTKGRVAELSNSSLGLAIDGVRRDFSQADVFQIRQWRHDSVKNGALIGAGVGLTLSIIAVVSVCDYDCNGAAAVGAIGYATGIGAAIGVGLDALIPAKQTVFRNVNRTSGKFRVQPVLNRSGKGVKVAFSF